MLYSPIIQKLSKIKMNVNFLYLFGERENERHVFAFKKTVVNPAEFGEKSQKTKIFSKLKKNMCLMCIDQKLLFLSRKHIKRK